MSVGCNEVQSTVVKYDKNVERMRDVLNYWSKKPKIEERYSMKVTRSRKNN